MKYGNCLCKSNIRQRDLLLKDGTCRRFYACTKNILHSYTMQELKDVNFEHYKLYAKDKVAA